MFYNFVNNLNMNVVSFYGYCVNKRLFLLPIWNLSLNKYPYPRDAVAQGNPQSTHSGKWWSEIHSLSVMSIPVHYTKSTATQPAITLQKAPANQVGSSQFAARGILYGYLESRNVAQDPAFLFYPGDYLRDTQNLSESVQVAYDRIMCEHMRNICIRQEQLKFFTKRLTDDEKEQLMYVLSEVEGGYQITWVAESISKRKAYSESRRQNRTKKDPIISKTYVPHMENEDENEIEDRVGIVKRKDVDFSIVPTEFLPLAEKWVKYKKEIKDLKYGKEGWQSFVTQVKKNCLTPADFEFVMDYTMSNGYKGIVWEKLKDRQNGQGISKNDQRTANYISVAHEVTREGE